MPHLFDKGNVYIPNGYGITFDGANVLNVFVPGTWTPVITGSITNPSTLTYGTRHGTYIRINNLVIFQATIPVSTIAGGSGNAFLSLPLTAFATGRQTVSGVLKQGGGNRYIGQLEIAPSTSVCTFEITTGTLGVTAIFAGDQITYSGAYFVA